MFGQFRSVKAEWVADQRADHHTIEEVRRILLLHAGVKTGPVPGEAR